MMMIQNTDMPRKLNIKWRTDGEENDYIIYQHPVTGMLDILNPVAAEIFVNCNGEKTVDEIADILTKKFKGAKKQIILSDIKQFLEHMVKEEVMIITAA